MLLPQIQGRKEQLDEQLSSNLEKRRQELMSDLETADLDSMRSQLQELTDDLARAESEVADVVARLAAVDAKMEEANKKVGGGGKGCVYYGCKLKPQMYILAACMHTFADHDLYISADIFFQPRDTKLARSFGFIYESESQAMPYAPLCSLLALLL